MLESLFNKVAGLKAHNFIKKKLQHNFIKKKLQHRCFPVNIAKLLRKPVLKNICEQLLLRDGESALYDKYLKYLLI